MFHHGLIHFLTVFFIDVEKDMLCVPCISPSKLWWAPKILCPSLRRKGLLLPFFVVYGILVIVGKVCSFLILYGVLILIIKEEKSTNYVFYIKASVGRR